jgi:hypothetical protein
VAYGSGFVQFAAEAWVQPTTLGGTRDIIVSGDGRFALRGTVEGSNVRFTATVTGTDGVMQVMTSELYPAGAWYLVAIAASENGQVLVVNGDRYENTIPRIEFAIDSLRIGGGYGGLIDEVWVSAFGYDPLPRYCPVSGIRVEIP